MESHKEMDVSRKIAVIIKKICVFFSSIEDGDYEVYRSEFEASMGGRALERGENKSYLDPEVEAAWIALCKSKTEEVLKIW